MLFLLLNLFLLFCVIILALVLSMIWPPDSPWAPFWTTNASTARVMCTLAKVTEKTVVYDLGCGTGTAVGVAAKEFGARCVGIEIDPLRFINAWINIHWRWRVSTNVTLVRGNFFDTSFTSADVFFIYLIPNALKRLTPKFLKEVKPGALFVSYVYAFPMDLFKGKLTLLKHDEVHRIYVYRLNGK